MAPAGMHAPVVRRTHSQPDKASPPARADPACLADPACAHLHRFTRTGVMGRHYAAVEGRSPAVATAMYEGILPRFSGDALPCTPAGVLVSLADK